MGQAKRKNSGRLNKGITLETAQPSLIVVIRQQVQQTTKHNTQRPAQWANRELRNYVNNNDEGKRLEMQEKNNKRKIRTWPSVIPLLCKQKKKQRQVGKQWRDARMVLVKS